MSFKIISETAEDSGKQLGTALVASTDERTLALAIFAFVIGLFIVFKNDIENDIEKDDLLMKSRAKN